MKILFYCPYNQAVPYIESLMEQFVLEGHEVFLITNETHGGLHENAAHVGVKLLAFRKNYSVPGLKQFSRIHTLVSLCNKYDIDICYTHYQEANIIGVSAQYFTTTKWVPTRHHSNCAYIDNNFREKIADKLINRFCRLCISPSEVVSDQMITKEGANPDKIVRINYGYNFDTMGKFDKKNADAIRMKYETGLLLVEAARLIPEKRHFELLDILKELSDHNLPVRLILLGKGPLEEAIKSRINDLDLHESVILEGFKKNVQDYFKAADLVIHLSISEASNSAIKEAALCGTPAMVCSGVGDFDMYIENGISGFLLNPENPLEEAVYYLKSILNRKYNLEEMGNKLKNSVLNNFDVKEVINEYRNLHKILITDA